MKLKILVALLLVLMLGTAVSAEAHPRWKRGRGHYHRSNRAWVGPRRVYVAPGPAYGAPHRYQAAPGRGYYRRGWMPPGQARRHHSHHRHHHGRRW